MKKKIYILSHSSIDLSSVLSLYERHHPECDVTILVFATEQNFRFLQELKLRNAALELLQFKSRATGGKRRIVKYVLELFAEKRHLDQLIAQIQANRDNELYFHSYDNDPHAGYLACRVASSNRVILVDALGLRPRSLPLRQLMTPTGFRNLAYLAVITFVFGRRFILSGTRSYPMLSLNLKKLRLAADCRPAGQETGILAKYRYPLPARGKLVVLLYADAFGVSEDHHVSVIRMVIDCLKRRGYQICVKVHPQSNPPSFLKDDRVREIPKYVPFEFVDLSGVSLVVGIAGAAPLCTGAVPTVSLLKLLYQEDSDYYRTGREQLSQNPAIIFVASVAELDDLATSVMQG